MNKAVVTEKITQAIQSWESAGGLAANPSFQANANQLGKNLKRIHDAHSGSWFGYQANVYYVGLRPPRPGQHFNIDVGLSNGFGLTQPSANWVAHTPDEIEKEAMEGVDQQSLRTLAEASERAYQIFREVYDTILIIADMLLDEQQSTAVERIRDEIKKIKGKSTEKELLTQMMPRDQYTRDTVAQRQGIWPPPHCVISARQVALLSPFEALDKLIKASRSLLKFVEMYDTAGRIALKSTGKVFIGHGRSLVWRELKDFLEDRLHLEVAEFNEESTSGVVTMERLQKMLEASSFAFLVMTAEDEHADKTVHARENVIHEVGLFQSRLGINKAIVLLEEGCPEFSNIHGLGQIRFPSGDIRAKFEDIREVLEREGIV